MVISEEKKEKKKNPSKTKTEANYFTKYYLRQDMLKCSLCGCSSLCRNLTPFKKFRLSQIWVSFRILFNTAIPNGRLYFPIITLMLEIYSYDSARWPLFSIMHISQATKPFILDFQILFWHLPVTIEVQNSSTPSDELGRENQYFKL